MRRSAVQNHPWLHKKLKILSQKQTDKKENIAEEIQGATGAGDRRGRWKRRRGLQTPALEAPLTREELTFPLAQIKSHRK